MRKTASKWKYVGEGLVGAGAIVIDLALCDGVACMRCERACSEEGFDLIKLLTLEVKVP
jgi:ferredoxin